MSTQVAEYRDVESNVQDEVPPYELLNRCFDYSKKALLYELSLILAFLAKASYYSASACMKAFIALLMVAFFTDLSMVVHLYSSRTGLPCAWHYVPLYLSAASLMLAPYFYLLALNALYAVLAVPPLACATALGLLFTKECLRGHGVVAGASYREYDAKLKHFFDVAAGINTIASSGGVMAAVLGNAGSFAAAAPPGRDVELFEYMLYLNVVAAVSVMLLATARPTFRHDGMPRKLFQALELVSRGLPWFLMLTALVGAAELVGGLAALAFSLDFVELAARFASTFYTEENAGLASRMEHQDILQRMSVVLATGYFTFLMGLYAKNAERTAMAPAVTVLDKARMLLYFTAFVCSMSRTALNARAASQRGVWARVLQILSSIRVAVMLLAAIDGISPVVTYLIRTK